MVKDGDLIWLTLHLLKIVAGFSPCFCNNFYPIEELSRPRDLTTKKIQKGERERDAAYQRGSSSDSESEQTTLTPLCPSRGDPTFVLTSQLKKI